MAHFAHLSFFTLTVVWNEYKTGLFDGQARDLNEHMQQYERAASKPMTKRVSYNISL